MANFCTKCGKKLRLIAGVGGYLEGEEICTKCSDELAKKAKGDKNLRWIDGSWRYMDRMEKERQKTEEERLKEKNLPEEVVKPTVDHSHRPMKFRGKTVFGKPLAEKCSRCGQSLYEIVVEKGSSGLGAAAGRSFLALIFGPLLGYIFLGTERREKPMKAVKQVVCRNCGYVIR